MRFLEINARPDVYCFAIPNAGRRSLRVGALMKAEGLRAGVADVCVMLSDGRVRWLETKRGKGRQSNAQKGFQAICERLGHHYAIAKSFDEAVAILEFWGALKKGRHYE